MGRVMVGDKKWKTVVDPNFKERPAAPRPSERVKLSWWRRLLRKR